MEINGPYKGELGKVMYCYQQFDGKPCWDVKIMTGKHSHEKGTWLAREGQIIKND